MNIRKRVWTYQGRKASAWLVEWREHGRRRQKQFPTRREAELYRDKLVRERYAEEYGELLGPITFKEFLNVYEAKKPWRTESYRARVLSALRQAPFLDRYVTDIGGPMVEAYREARLQEVEPSTLRQDLAALHDCFKWAVKLHYLHKNPCAGVERPSLPMKQDDPARYLTPEEFEKLSKVAGRDRPLYEFAVWTGLRITELIALTWEDLNLREGYVLVRRGKGRKQRIVPLLPRAEAALRKLPRHIQSAKVFGWMSDRHATLRRFQRRCEWAGIPRYRFHDLRHTFGSWAAQSGVDLEVISQAMGHTSTTTTRLYAHLSPAYKRRELLKMQTAARRRQQFRKSAKS